MNHLLHKQLKPWPRPVSLLFGAAALLAIGCIYDADDRCEEGEVFLEDIQTCGCPGGQTLTEVGCIKCGKHEVGSASGCDCEPGYERATPKDSCKEAELPPPPPAGDGGSADSTGDEPEASSMPAVLPSAGLGDTCASDAECTQDATYCDLFMGGGCLVQGCTLEPNNCPSEHICCDLSAFVPGLTGLCVPGEACGS